VLAAGIELLGEYQGSGCAEASFLVRRGDGRMLVVSGTLYALAAEIDGRRAVVDIADRLTSRLGRVVTAENIRFLVDHKLAPLGIAVDPAHGAPRPTPNPLLRLRMPVAVIPSSAVSGISAALYRLFWPPVILGVLAGFSAFDGWLFFVHGIGSGLRATVADPRTMVFAYLLVIAAATFHELGHAAAGRYGGVRPGRIGVGLYLIWPAFFSDMTESYRLGRAGRLRTDLGGLYFNAVFVLACAGAYGMTGSEAVLAAIALQHLLIAYQFFPFLRLDGYYVVSDLIGVPDLFARIRPVLAGLVPGRATSPAVRELRPRARVLVTAWVLITVPLLAMATVLAVVRAPELVRLTRTAATADARVLVSAVQRRDPASGTLATVQLAMLAVAPLGLLLTASGLARRGGRARRTEAARAVGNRQAAGQPVRLAGGLERGASGPSRVRHGGWRPRAAHRRAR
jgi:putative peptide zinc metalloprotease protein